MSLILEALNRAEQERKHQDQIPDIHTIHATPAAPVNHRKPWWLILMVLLLVIVAGLIGAWLWQVSRLNTDTPTVQPASVKAEPGADAPVVETPPPVSAQVTSVPAVDRASVVEVAPAQSVVSQGESSTAQSQSGTAVNDLYTQAANEPDALAPVQVEMLYQGEETPAAASVSESVVAPFTERQSPPAATSLPERLALEPRYLSSIPGVPYFNDLPWSQKQEIPTISYSRHDYLANGVSSVVINGETRGIGNLVSSGQFIVEEIMADGVVLRYRDKRFKLNALNGWVNM